MQGTQDENQADTQSEAVLGQLINLCGKMRMLSHRAVMIALLDGVGEDVKSLGAETYARAVDEFAAIASKISTSCPSNDMPADVQEAMRAVNAVSLDQEAQIEQFLNAARRNAPGRGGVHRDPQELVAFAEFVATTLLATLNEIVAGIGRALDYAMELRSSRTEVNREVIAKSVTQIEKISQAVFMISVNASIEAARAGEQGKGFNILASEIRSLSQTSAASVQQLRDQLEVLP